MIFRRSHEQNLNGKPLLVHFSSYFSGEAFQLNLQSLLNVAEAFACFIFRQRKP